VFVEQVVRAGLRKNLNALQSMSTLLKNPKAKLIFGTDDELLKSMTKFSDTHKKSWFGKGSLEFHVNLLNKHIDEFQGVSGFDKSVKDAINNANENVQDGFWHGLKATDGMGIKKGDVKEFDMQFDDLLDCGSASNPAGCKFDIELLSNDPKYVEFKSYQNAADIPIKQFKAYISRVDNLSEMKYVFNAQKLAANGNDAKVGMKAFLKSNETTIITSLKTSVKTELGLPNNVTALTNAQIDLIVNKIVEVK
jgi:hypothetical protein